MSALSVAELRQLYPTPESVNDAVKAREITPAMAASIIAVMAAAPAAKAPDKTAWRSVDESTLPPALMTAWRAKRSADQKAKEAREAFEAAFIAAKTPPPGKKFAFSHKWGKLSVAVVDDDGSSRKSSGTANFDDL